MAFKIKYLFSDMDGTLLDPRKHISDETVQAVQAFTTQGGFFAVATGRSPEICRPFLKKVPVNAPCILLNGAGVYDFDTGRYLHQEYLPGNLLPAICRTAQNAYSQICIEAFAEGPIQILSPDCILDHYITEEKQPYVYTDYAESGRYMKLLLYAHPEKLKTVYTQLRPLLEGKVSFTFSSPFYLEILPLGVSKGTALQWICETGGLSREQVAAVGDFDNDQEMLRYSGLGAAPANASPAAKAAANLLLPDNDHHCVSNLIHTFMK
mgnify:CR=1 FL=1